MTTRGGTVPVTAPTITSTYSSSAEHRQTTQTTTATASKLQVQKLGNNTLTQQIAPLFCVFAAVSAAATAALPTIIMTITSTYIHEAGGTLTQQIQHITAAVKYKVLKIPATNEKRQTGKEEDCHTQERKKNGLARG